jgi:hypothetical protein
MTAITTTSAAGNGNTNGANYRGAFAIMTSFFSVELHGGVQ